MQIFKRLIIFVLALCVGLPLLAQDKEEQDSLVILMSSKSAQMVDIEGASYRKIIGPARFLHNGTYLLCDTALWNVETRIIEAWGNVSILQEETVLTSDNLTYIIDEDLAKFRGSVVQLLDKDHNTLRTRYLDYNTKDSVAVFDRGGSMRDKDGQIIESIKGTYDSKIKEFTFEKDVNMFTDSIFVKTNDLLYQSNKDMATFGSATDAWKDDNMLSSNSGWYDKARELFFFNDNVHVMSLDQEGWCDSLYFFRSTSDVQMLGNAQITDTTRNVFSLAGRIDYVDTLSRVTLTRDPAVITQTEDAAGVRDTVYLGADKLVYYTMKMCDIHPAMIKDAEDRLSSIDVDPVGAFRKKAAEAAAKAAEEAAKNDPNRKPDAAKSKSGADKPKGDAGKSKDEAGKSKPQDGRSKPDMTRMSADSLAAGSDSLAVGSDSLAIGADSLAMADSLEAEPLDTTKIGFLEALKNVRIYKKDMQITCDSLVYSDLDSLARLFNEPFVWQEVVRQYSADSISVVVRNNSIDKASLMSNAFIAIQEDTSHYDQIRGTEVLAYFDSKGGLKRFDVLGGSSTLFYLEENGTLATVNKTESKMLSATFQDGEIQRIYYYDAPKNDGYPIVQLKEGEKNLKGFNWQGARRPVDRNAVTPLSLRPSERRKYDARPRAQYKQTDIYFPGYIDDIHRQIQVRDSLKIVRQREARIAEQRAKEQARLDSIAFADSMALADSLALVDSLATADSLAALQKFTSDSLAVADSMKNKDGLEAGEKVMTPEELKAKKKEEAAKAKAEAKKKREAAKKKKEDERNVKWAELDKRDAEKLMAKENERLEKQRAKKRKALAEEARRAERELQILQRYKDKYAKKKAKEEERALKKAAKAPSRNLLED